MTSNKTRAALIKTTVALCAFGLGAGAAGAVTSQVRKACSNDYYKFCPSHEVGSPSLRQCMRQAGKRLSPRCIDALADAGEIKRPR